MPNITLTCATCDTAKPAEEFAKDKHKKTGRKSSCKECDNARSREYYNRAGREKRGHERAIKSMAPERACLTCSNPFEPRNDKHRYCSYSCAGIARRIDWKRAQRPDRARGKPQGVTQLSIGACATCGDMFAPRNVAHVNCSPGCTAKARRMRENYRGHKRRVWSQLTRTDLIDPVEIYERDNWKCNICGDQIDKTLKYPDMDSVSLDHVRPLSWGGTHTSENLAASHLRCNLSKRDTGPIDAEAKEFRAQAITSIKSMFDLHGDWTTSATHEDIMVDTEGRTYNLRTGRIFQKETVIDGKQIRRAIVVAETFLGARPNHSCYVAHINGDKTDFTPSNLEWRMPAHQIKKTRCRRGHEKSGTNLTRSGLCRSCGNATSIKRQRGGTMSEAQVKELADAYYQRLDGGRRELGPRARVLVDR